MQTLWAAFKSLLPWQIAVLFAVLFATAGATYGVYAGVTNDSGASLAENQQLIPVRLADLVNQVSTNGNVTFPNREELTFGSQGTVEEVLAEVGQQVNQGQLLAKLDSTTVANLNLAVAQARVDLQAAETSLDELINPSPLVLAQARQAVADAQFKVQEADDASDDAQEPFSQQQIKSQEETVANAKLAFQDAEQAVRDLVQAHSQLLAEVRKGRTDAELALQEALDALADLEPNHAQQLAQAQQTRADAEVTVEAAQEALSEFQPGYLLELVAARQAKADAEVELNSAQDALDQFQPGYGQDLVEARQDKADAEVAFKVAQDAFDLFEAANSRTLVQAREEKAAAQALLDSTLSELASLVSRRESGVPGLDLEIVGQQALVEIRESRLALAQEDVLEVEQREAALEVTTSDLEKARSDLADLEAGPDETKRQQLVTAIDSAQSKFDQSTEDLAKLELGTDSLQWQKLEASAELAQAILDQARDDLAKLESGVDLLLRQQSEAAVELAQADLAAAAESENNVNTEGNPAGVELQRSILALAVSNLQVKEVYLVGITTAGASPGEVAAGRKDVDAAQAHLDTTGKALEAIIAGVDAAEVGLKQAVVTLAMANLDQAETDLTELLEGPDPVTMALRRHDVAVAQANLVEAEDDLIELVNGPDSLDRELLEASVTSARTALDGALRLLDQAFLITPVTGFISLVNVEEGDEVGANAVIVEVVDQTVVEIDGIVDEIDVLLVKEGARATVSMDSLPGRSLDGVISEIAPAALNQQGVVTYPIRIQIQVPQGLQLREGLSATAVIILQEEKNVLLVPQQALYGSFDHPVVRVMTSAGVQERPVVLGDSDGFWTAVREGLVEGDQVVMEASQTTSDPFAAFRQLRGGFGGGGFSRGGGRQQSGDDH